MALLAVPIPLILDEPVNGLDPEGIVKVRALLPEAEPGEGHHNPDQLAYPG